MSVFLSIVLSLPLFNSQVGFRPRTFQNMLDSTQIVVIAKVDSIWYSMDTIEGIANDKPFKHIRPITNILAGVVALYAKSDTLALPSGSVHIIHPGGEYPDGGFLEYPSQPKFTVGEVFLTPIFKMDRMKTSKEPLYEVLTIWKYTIANDSVFLYGEMPIPLCDAICKLSTSFIQKANQ